MKESKTAQWELKNDKSSLGPYWLEIFCSDDVPFSVENFETAMTTLIHQPEINSTVLLRADVLVRNHEKQDFEGSLNIESDEPILLGDVDDLETKSVPLDLSFRNTKLSIVRRLIPRNPFKDHIINQTCLILEQENKEGILVVYIPHISQKSECPYYLPAVEAVGIYFNAKEKCVSLNYIPFNYENPESLENLRVLDKTNRNIRIALRLLQTSIKHSTGIMNGYEKRVLHDLMVSKIAFQNRYISLKKKYSHFLVENWQESTDPKKHVFEDIAIAAFLIELWGKIYGKKSFKFADLGCGNGVLVYILLSEGYNGVGIDARARKSWAIYPEAMKDKFKEQVIVPKILLEEGGGLKQHFCKQGDEAVIYNNEQLKRSEFVNLGQFDSDTFIIGNHSDELTLWMPLFGHDFMVIPCCSHALSGKRARFLPSKVTRDKTLSAYSGLVEHVEELASLVGWHTEREMLRIPSTKNCAIIGYKRKEPKLSVSEILAQEGGADGWVENTIALMKSAPRGH